MNNTKIGTTLTSSTPIVEVQHKNDTTYSLLPLKEWLVESIRAASFEGEEVKGAAKAAQSRAIVELIGEFKEVKEDWKTVKDHYNVIAKAFQKDERAFVKSLDLKSIRRWKSGNATASFTADATQAEKADGIKKRATKAAPKKRATKVSKAAIEALLACGVSQEVIDAANAA